MVRLRPHSVSSGCTDTQFDLTPAIAAAFAHELVDDHPLVGIGEPPALPAATLLRGASLVIDQYGNAGDRGELLLDRDQLVAVMNRQPARPLLVLGVFPRLVGHDNDAPSAFGRHLARDFRHRQSALVGLAAGHCDRVVEQDFVSDVHAGGDRGADGQVAGMIVGAVTKILKDMGTLGERRLADPVRALPAHLRVAQCRAVHPLRHVVATDAGISAHALRHDGG